MVDYSKWKNIEISDDEDDTHPNIDTPSLFRWRHQARLERMADYEREKEDLKTAKQSLEAKRLDLEERQKSNTDNTAELANLLIELEKENAKLSVRENELRSKERKMPWNVDTISKPGFAKTVLNKQPKLPQEEELTEEEREKRMKDFIAKYEDECKEFGMLSKFEDSKRLLNNKPYLVNENLANYLVMWAIDLEMDEKHDLMKHVAHQCICIQYLLELSKQLSVQPQSCVNTFFSKFQVCPLEYKQQFDDEVKLLIGRVEKRAREKLVLNKEERVGPGGLDPLEVFEELPDSLKACFERRDVDLLKKTIAEMDVKDATYYMKRCVDSGLWLPNARDDNSEMSNMEDSLQEDNDD